MKFYLTGNGFILTDQWLLRIEVCHYTVALAPVIWPDIDNPQTITVIE